MLSFKIVLDQRHLKMNGTYPLKLRVFQDRAFKECSLNIDLALQDWEANLQMVLSTNSNHTAINSKLATIKAKVQRIIFMGEELETINTPSKVIEQLKNKEQKKVIVQKPDILKYGKEQIAKLQIAGRVGNAIAYKCAISKLKAYVKTEKLAFEAVNYKFLEDFNTALLKEGIKINSIGLYMRTFRAIFNKAIKEDILEPKFYPFAKYKIKTEKTICRTLTKSEMSKILNYDIPCGNSAWHYQNLFALSYYLMGINFFDLLTLTKENLVDGRIIFKRRKTHKIYNILLQPKAKQILDYYFASNPISNNDFLLPFVKNKNNAIALKKDVLGVIGNTNEHLKKIAKVCNVGKNVSTYYGRYSWANIAKELGYSKDMIAEALGHEYGNKVTGIYLDNYDNDLIDAMNEKVIEAVINTKSQSDYI